MQRTTWEINSSRRVAGVAKGTIAGLWPEPRKLTIVRKTATPMVPPWAADDEHDGWQPIRRRRRPLLVIALESARRLKGAG